MQNLEFKRGATFEFEIALTDEDDVPVILDVANMRAELRDGSTLLSVLDIADTATPGTYLLSTDDDTSEWDYGVVMTDIRATIDGKIRYSDTVAFTIVPQITREAEEVAP
jgi:hypothetical protein